MGGIPFPVDFASLCEQAALYMGVVVSAVVGIFAVVALINMGVKWVRNAFFDASQYEYVLRRQDGKRVGVFSGDFGDEVFYHDGEDEGNCFFVSDDGGIVDSDGNRYELE